MSLFLFAFVWAPLERGAHERYGLCLSKGPKLRFLSEGKNPALSVKYGGFYLHCIIQKLKGHLTFHEYFMSLLLDFRWVREPRWLLSLSSLVILP